MSNHDAIDQRITMADLTTKVIGLLEITQRTHDLSQASTNDLKTINTCLRRIYAEVDIADKRRELDEIESRMRYLKSSLEHFARTMI